MQAVFKENLFCLGRDGSGVVLKEEALETVNPQSFLFLVLGLEQVPVLRNGQVSHLEPQRVARTLAHTQVAAKDVALVGVFWPPTLGHQQHP